MSTLTLFGASIYLFAYIAVVGGIWYWRLNRRNDKPPVKEKLLRAPGESLHRKVERFDEHLFLHFAGSALVPLLVMAIGLLLLGKSPESFQPWGILILILIIGGILYLSARWILRLLDQRRNHYLGYFGERHVGEILEALRPKGYFIYHDVPAHEANPPFNIDHVIVGPTGIFCVETKTRRKGAARPGFEEHKIIFDGQQLIYPWGQDTFGLAEARNRAGWLESWLNQLLGRKTPVQAILVFPGWWVEEQAVNTVRVINPKQIEPIIQRGNVLLSPEQIELIVNELETRCRDIEF